MSWIKCSHDNYAEDCNEMCLCGHECKYHYWSNKVPCYGGGKICMCDGFKQDYDFKLKDEEK